MARIHRVAALTAISTTIYILLLFRVLPVLFVDPDVVDAVLPLIPWWALVSFGSYSLWSLGWGLCTFRDCPEAYTELLEEVSQAKHDLRARGVAVD